MDVGPDGFIMPKRPDRGNEAGALGILARYESSRGVLYRIGRTVGEERRSSPP